MPGFSAFILNLSKSGNILFRSIPNGSCLFSSSIIVIDRRDNSLVHVEMATVELHVNATYAQHPALKSVYGKSQSVTDDKLFSSYRTLFELAQGLRDFKTSNLNCSYEALVQKEALTICQDRVFVSFYVLYHYHQF